MKKFILIATVFAAICSFSVAPAFAEDEDSLQYFNSEGKLRWDSSGCCYATERGKDLSIL